MCIMRRRRQWSNRRAPSQAWQQQQRLPWLQQQSRLAVALRGCLLARQRRPPFQTLPRNLQNGQRHQHQ
jgi:hypothetical protein